MTRTAPFLVQKIQFAWLISVALRGVYNQDQDLLSHEP